jgi:hypothetical protein
LVKSKGYLRENQAFCKVFGGNPRHPLPTDRNARDWQGSGAKPDTPRSNPVVISAAKERKMTVSETSNDAHTPAIQGVNTQLDGWGVLGKSDKGAGVNGLSVTGRGVMGWSDSSYGVSGDSKNSTGVRGTSTSGIGIEGYSTTGSGVGARTSSGTAVVAHSDTGDGVFGEGRRGVVGRSETFQGVYGSSGANSGVVGESASMHAVFGITHSTFAGVYGTSDAGGTGVCGESPTGVGVLGKGKLAGRFEGNVEVTGDIQLTGGADCAEEFDVAQAGAIEPGTVMVLGDDEALHTSTKPYDRRVVGVVSGAGDCRPGLVLDRQELGSGRKPIALLGKVFCKADASCAPIKVGDLLTTSTTPGHAMRISDPIQAFGAVIGKALRPLDSGQGLIPIIIALQ